MTTGRFLAASPRSAIHASPGRGFIELVQGLLLARSRTDQIEDVMFDELDDFGDSLAHFRRCFWFPLPQLFIQLSRQSVH